MGVYLVPGSFDQDHLVQAWRLGVSFVRVGIAVGLGIQETLHVKSVIGMHMWKSLSDTM